MRLINAEGKQVGVVSIQEAQAEAEQVGLDLVEIAMQNNLPVCRIVDFGKYQFQQRKKIAAAKKNQKEIQIKEVKFRPTTDEGDYHVKLRNLIRFLEEGNKAKVSLRYRGREIVHPEIGQRLMENIKRDLVNHAVVEQEPKLEGKQMTMMLIPKKK